MADPTSFSEPIVAFLDANVLAKALTRTLLITGAPASGLRVVWSAYAQDEAERHLGAGATRLRDLVNRFGWQLSRAGDGSQRFVGTSVKDRQILADAIAAGAHYVVTEDVDDFGDEDLASAGVSAVNHDLFLAERLTEVGYREALAAIASGRTRPPTEPADIHAALGRNHPLLATRWAALFPGVTIAEPTHPAPSVIFRGSRCLRCGLVLGDPRLLQGGQGPECRSESSG